MPSFLSSLEEPTGSHAVANTVCGRLPILSSFRVRANLSRARALEAAYYAVDVMFASRAREHMGLRDLGKTLWQAGRSQGRKGIPSGEQVNLASTTGSVPLAISR